MKLSAALLCVVLACPVSGQGSPPPPIPPVPPPNPSLPYVQLPATTSGAAGAFVTIPSITNGKEVAWYSPDPGLQLFPPELLKSSRIAVVTSVVPGTYRLVAFTALGDVPARSNECVITIGQVPPGPVPPGPIPPVPPVPPGPQPIPGSEFRVLIVYETRDLGKMPKAQELILYSDTVRSYLNSKSPLGPDGKTHDWRIYDKDVATDGESKLWQDAMKRPRASHPWIAISSPKGGFEGPLPYTVEETMALLKKFGE